MKTLMLMLALLLCFACGDGGGNTGSTSAPCPGKVKTTASGVCLPFNWAQTPAGQVDRTDGGFVLLEGGVPTPELAGKINDAVLAGLNQMLVSSKYHNPTWTRKPTTGYYKIVMIKSMATNQDGTPALLVGGIQSAGTVINVFADLVDRGETIIVLPEPDWSNLAPTYWEYLQASARHEGEHDVEWANDKGIFHQKAVTGDIHPHWSMPPGTSESRGFASQPGKVVDKIVLGDAKDAVTLPEVKKQ
jgi:hypothetical protein